MVVHREGAAVDRLVDLLAELRLELGADGAERVLVDVDRHHGAAPGLLTVTTPFAMAVATDWVDAPYPSA